MICNSEAAAAWNTIFWQNRVQYKLKLNINRCVNFSPSCLTAAKASICLQLLNKFTEEILQRVHPKAEDWVGFLLLGFWLVGCLKLHSVTCKSSLMLFHWKGLRNSKTLAFLPVSWWKATMVWPDRSPSRSLKVFFFFFPARKLTDSTSQEESQPKCSPAVRQHSLGILIPCSSSAPNKVTSRSASPPESTAPEVSEETRAHGTTET